MHDIALIGQVLIFGNRRAFDSLVRKYQGAVRRFLLNLTAGDKALSDDLAQETFIKAYTSLETFKKRSNFLTWLYRIAYNVFYDYIRTQKETEEIDSAQVDANYQVEQNDVGREMDIYQALGKLKEVERTCITLFYMEDLSMEKIAGITGLPPNTIKSHLKRGKEKLATYLKGNGYDGKR